MAHETWKISEFSELARTLIEAGRLIQEQVTQAREWGMDEIVMQGRLMFESRARIMKFAGDMRTHLSDQHASQVSNSPATWELNRAKYEYEKQRKDEKAEAVPTPGPAVKRTRTKNIAQRGPARGSLAGRVPARRKKD